MTVPFAVTGSKLIPFVSVEFDASRASQGPALLSHRALLIGQRTGGSAADNSLVKVSSADEVVALAGRGSMLHRMALAWFAKNKQTECYIGVLADNTASVKATSSITVSGPATASGTIALLVGGDLVTVAVTSGDSANTIASAIATAIGKHATGTVTFSGTPDAGDNVTVGGVEFVGTTGAVTPGDATFSVDTGPTEAGASLAAQIRAHATTTKLVTATASGGVVTLYARAKGTDGNSIALATTDAVEATVSGATLTGGAAGTGGAPNLPVHATVSSAVVTLHAMNPGAVGNEYDIRYNYNDGEALPTGVSLALVQPSGGTSAPTLTSLITAMGDQWFTIIANPYTDSTSLTALETELADRAGPDRQIDGVMISAKDDTRNNVSTLGDSRNSQFSVILRTNESPTPIAEYAAHVAAVTAISVAIDPARPLQTLELPYIKAPAESDRDTNAQRNTLLGDGIATTRVGPGNMVQVERLVTTYQRNAAGSPDTAYRDANTVFTLQYLRYDFVARITTRYPRHKLASDGPVAPGQAIVTPKTMRAECVMWFKDMADLGLVEAGTLDQFKTDLIVERNESDPNRLDILLPPDLVNQLVGTAALMQFRN